MPPDPVLGSPVLGVDYGLKRVGLAVSDPARRVAVGVGVIEGLQGRALARAIVNSASERRVSEIVIGSPSGTGRDGGAVKQGADDLAQTLTRMGIKVERWNEDYTTATALSDRKRVGGKRNVRRGWEDEAAAIFILQDFLDHSRILLPE